MFYYRPLFSHTVDCKWQEVGTECPPDCEEVVYNKPCPGHCASAKKTVYYYIITQYQANGGKDCPPKVYKNETIEKPCCGKGEA